MMKKFFILVGLIASTSAFAQADKFSGFSVGLNTGFAASTVKTVDTGDSSTFALGATNTPFDINFAYTMSLASNTTVGFGLTYDLSSPKVINVSDQSSSGLTTDGKLNNHYSIYIEPGYAFNDSSLGYFKLGYHSGKMALEGVSKSITGTGYGFGMRHLIDKNLYLNLGVESITYNSATYSDLSATAQLTQTLATVGIGYKF